MITPVSVSPVYIRAIPATAQLLQRSIYRLRWSDMDAFGHVNNAMYFTYFEQVRVDWLESIGARHELVLANVSCSFLRPLKHPAELEVRLYAGSPGHSSLPTWYEILQPETTAALCAIGHGTVVWYDHQAGESVRIPADVLANLAD